MLEPEERLNEAVFRVTAQIERAIKAVTINAQSWEDLMLLDLGELCFF